MTFTTIPVKRQTLGLLKQYKIGGKTYDDVIMEFIEATPPEAFMREHFRRLREEKGIPWGKVRKRLKL